MANTIHVDIVSAERELFSGEATMVFAPAVQGEVGIAPMHTPLLTTLNPGDVRVQTAEGGEEIQQYVYVLEANLVLHNGLTIPLMSEFLSSCQEVFLVFYFFRPLYNL